MLRAQCNEACPVCFAFRDVFKKKVGRPARNKGTTASCNLDRPILCICEGMGERKPFAWLLASNLCRKQGTELSHCWTVKTVQTKLEPPSGFPASAWFRKFGAIYGLLQRCPCGSKLVAKARVKFASRGESEEEGRRVAWITQSHR